MTGTLSSNADAPGIPMSDEPVTTKRRPKLFNTLSGTLFIGVLSPTNDYELTDEVITKVNRHWQFALDVWDYERLEPSHSYLSGGASA